MGGAPDQAGRTQSGLMLPTQWEGVRGPGRLDEVDGEHARGDEEAAEHGDAHLGERGVCS